MRYASPILANISTFSRGIKWQIFISRIWSPLSKLFLSPPLPPTPDFPSFLFLLLRGTRSRKFYIVLDSYSSTIHTYFVYIYIYICICIIYSVLSWYRFVSIIVTLGNMRRKNLWIMCIFVIFVGDKFGLERSMKDTVICKIHIY